MIKAITLRKLPPDVSEAIEREAERTGASLNATVIRLLREALVPGGRDKSDGPKRFRDLDAHAGTWSREEADEFDRFLAESRRIDKEMLEHEWERRDLLQRNDAHK